MGRLQGIVAAFVAAVLLQGCAWTGIGTGLIPAHPLFSSVSDGAEVLGTVRELQVGTVAIKSSVDADGVVQNYTVMIKEDAGFDAEHGDWRYEMRTPAGEIANDPDSGTPMSGAITMCIDCHQAAAGTDFLAGTGLR